MLAVFTDVQPRTVDKYSSSCDEPRSNHGLATVRATQPSHNPISIVLEFGSDLDIIAENDGATTLTPRSHHGSDGRARAFLMHSILRPPGLRGGHTWEFTIQRYLITLVMIILRFLQ